MSKILVLGDIHGRTIWKEIIVRENPDFIIFLGDYCTTHEGISPEEQIVNLEEILLKKEEGAPIALLRGNHDIQLLGYYWADCYPKEPIVQRIMSEPKFVERFNKLTQWIYIDEELSTIFSHAGISKVWMENSGIKDVHDINNLAPSEIFGFTPATMWDNYGTSPTQPLTWIRPQVLAECNIAGWDQVIGHTPVQEITTVTTNDGERIWLCDALAEKQYLIIDNKDFIINKFE